MEKDRRIRMGRQYLEGRVARAVLFTLCSSLCFVVGAGWLFSSADSSNHAALEGSILGSRVVVPVALQAERELLATDLRGVSSEGVEAYLQDEFACGTEKVHSSRINDNYCDCEDGSDEPGTSACAGRILAQFYCNNFGYKSLYIESSKVDDGICDCCDGSDEPLNACANVCDEVGREYREQVQKKEKERSLGLERKQEYILSAEKALANTDSRKAALNSEMDKLKQDLSPLQQNLEKLEEEDQRAQSAQQKALLESRILALKLNDLNIKELQSIVVELAQQTGEGLALQGIVRDTFLRREESPSEEELQVEWLEHDEPESQEEDNVDDETKDESGTNPDKRKSELDQVRERVDHIQDQISALEQQLRQIEDEKTTDYGKMNEFWAIKDKCFSTKADQYTYEFCMFGNSQQDSTSLGSWNGFHEEHTVIAFTNGARCWNGPERSMTIRLECGAEELFHSVEEPSTCEYSAVFVTPAACH